MSDEAEAADGAAVERVVSEGTRYFEELETLMRKSLPEGSDGTSVMAMLLAVRALAMSFSMRVDRAGLPLLSEEGSLAGCNAIILRAERKRRTH